MPRHSTGSASCPPGSLVFELAADEALRVEDGVDGVHRALVLHGLAIEALGVGNEPGDLDAAALVVGDDLDTVVLSNSDAAGIEAEIDTDSF